MCQSLNKWLTSISQWDMICLKLKNMQLKNGRKKLMSVMENEIIKENLFNVHLDLLIEKGWPEDRFETWAEAVRRTHEEWEGME